MKQSTKRQSKPKSVYMAAIFSTSKGDGKFEVLEAKSIHDLLAVILKYDSSIIMRMVNRFDHSLLMKSGIDPDTIDFMIEVFDWNRE